MGVGGPREALSFRGAEIAAKTTTGDIALKWIRLEMYNEIWGMSHDASSPKSFTMVASDCRGTTLLLGGVFVALGSRIIPEDTNMSFKFLGASPLLLIKAVAQTLPHRTS